jgi:hypothetical protein
MEGNEMGDASFAECCRMLYEIWSILVINFSKCRLTDQGASYLAEVLESDDCKIRSVIIHWNQIKGKGSQAMAKAIKYSHTLLVFDASFNNFGSSSLSKKIIKKAEPLHAAKIEVEQGSQDKNDKLNDSLEGEDDSEFENYTQSSMKWSQTIRKNNVILHLDLSYNNFRKADIIHINEGLRRNHNIMGIHFNGNEATVDELGFVIPGKVWNPGELVCFTRIPRKFSLC